MKTLFVPILDNGQGDVKADFLDCFIRAFSGQNIHTVRVSDSDPRRARNRAAASFLESDCDRMLFVDSDIGFVRQHIDWLLENDLPIVGGIYPIKCLELKPCLCLLPDHKPVAAGGLAEAVWCGTGFLSIKREVFEALKTDENRYTTHGRPEWDFFQSGVVEGQYLSEDLGFCRLAREAGFKVMVDTRIQLQHEGSIKYPVKPIPDFVTVCPISMRVDVEAIWRGEYDMPLESQPKTVLDIGGNLGAFTLWAKQKWPSSSVVAFEPHPDNVKLYEINTKGLTGVSLFNAAVTAADVQTIELTEGIYPGRHSTSMPVGDHKLTVRAINAATIPSAEFVKLDTEGAELEILQSLDLSETKAVALEYHRRSDCDGIQSLLLGRGFRQYEHNEIDKDRGILKFQKP